MTSKQSQIGCLHDIQKHGIEKFKEKCKKASIKFWETI